MTSITREIQVTKRQRCQLIADAGGTNMAAESDFNGRWCFLRHRTVLKCKKKKNPWWLICTHSFISWKFSQTSVPGVFNLWSPSCDVMISARWVVVEEEESSGGGGGQQRRGGTSSRSFEQERRRRRWGESANKKKSAAPPEVTWNPRRRSAGGPELRRHASGLLKREEPEKEGEGEIVRGFSLSLCKSCERAGGGGYFSRVFFFSPPSSLFFFFSPPSDLRRIPARSAAAQESDPVRSVSPLRSSARSAHRNMMPQWEVPAPQPEPSTVTEPPPPPHPPTPGRAFFWIFGFKCPAWLRPCLDGGY